MDGLYYILTGIHYDKMESKFTVNFAEALAQYEELYSLHKHIAIVRPKYILEEDCDSDTDDVDDIDIVLEKIEGTPIYENKKALLKLHKTFETKMDKKMRKLLNKS